MATNCALLFGSIISIHIFLLSLRNCVLHALVWVFPLGFHHNPLGLHTPVHLPFSLRCRCSFPGFHQSPPLVPFVLSGLLDLSDGIVALLHVFA